MSDLFTHKDGPGKIRHFLKDTSASTIEIGDLVYLSSGAIIAASTAQHNLNFIGVAWGASASGNDSPVPVIIPTQQDAFAYPIATAATVTAGGEYQITGNQELTVSGTDPVAIAIRTEGSSVSTARVTFKVPTLFLGDVS